MKGDQILECRGLACPQPVIQTKEALEKMTGERLVVKVDNEAAHANVTRFAESQGHAVQSEDKDGVYSIVIQKKSGGPASDPTPIRCDPPRQGKMAVYISSEGMGQGSDELGRTLMTAFFETLSHFAGEISHIMLVNSGVKLAVEGSPVLDHLREFEQMGIEILACGACLNHFQLREKLRAGIVSNMFTIVDILSKVPRTLKP